MMSEKPDGHDPLSSAPEVLRKASAKLSGCAVSAVLGVAVMALMLTCLFSSFAVWERSKFTPLQRAAVDGDVESCRRLVRSGVRVDSPDNRGLTPLGYAIDRQQVMAVRALMELGANVNHVDNGGRTPLSYTVHAPFGKGWYSAETMKVRNEIAQLLLDHGADVTSADHSGHTALHWAVWDQNPDLIRVLLAAGADPTAKTSNGYTPMDIAAFPARENEAVIAALKESAPTSGRNNPVSKRPHR